MTFDADMLAALPRVRRFAWKLAGSRELAEDLVQDTVVRALANRESFQLGTNMSAWLCFICRNVFYSLKRKSWRSVELDEDWAARTLTSVDSPHSRLALKELLDAVALLPAEQSEALLMVAEGVDYDTAAQLLKVSVGTVKSRVSRARNVINLCFAETA